MSKTTPYYVCLLYFESLISYLAALFQKAVKSLGGEI